MDISDVEYFDREIWEQDDQITANPIFYVVQRRRIYGLEPSRAGGQVALNDEGGEVEEGGTKIGYLDVTEKVQPFFTRAGAERYIEANRHNMTDPAVFVDSAYRNPEWAKIREGLCPRLAARGQRALRRSSLGLALLLNAAVVADWRVTVARLLADCASAPDKEARRMKALARFARSVGESLDDLDTLTDGGGEDGQAIPS